MSDKHLPGCDAEGTMYDCDCEKEILRARVAELTSVADEAAEASIERDAWKQRAQQAEATLERVKGVQR